MKAAAQWYIARHTTKSLGWSQQSSWRHGRLRADTLHGQLLLRTCLLSARGAARSGLWRLPGKFLCPPCCRRHSNDVSHEATVCNPPVALLISPKPIASKAAALTCHTPLSGSFCYEALLAGKRVARHVDGFLSWTVDRFQLPLRTFGFCEHSKRAPPVQRGLCGAVLRVSGLSRPRLAGHLLGAPTNTG